MAYKIQPLVESGYDFAALFPEKQESVRQNTLAITDFDSRITSLLTTQ